MAPQEHFLSPRQRYQPIALPQHFSDEEMARDWTLSQEDRHEIERYRKDYRLYIAIQIKSVRYDCTVASYLTSTTCRLT